MTVYYYVEAYFKNHERPYLLANSKGMLYVTDNPERALEYLKDIGGATYEIIEAHEHFKKHYQLYPHLKADMTKAEHYEKIEKDIKQEITTIL